MIYKIGYSNYVSSSFKDELTKIYNKSYNVIPDNSNIYFTKNVKINRSVLDIKDTLNRVKKHDNIQYLIYEPVEISEYPLYFNPQTNSLEKEYSENYEIVYSIRRCTYDKIKTLEIILELINKKQEVVFVDSGYFNKSVNNGFLIDENNYNDIKTLVNSTDINNRELIYNMLVNSNLEKNSEYILELYYNNKYLINEFGDNISKYLLIHYKCSYVSDLFKNDFIFNNIKNNIIIERLYDGIRNSIYEVLDKTYTKNNIDISNIELHYEKLND